MRSRLSTYLHPTPLVFWQHNNVNLAYNIIMLTQPKMFSKRSFLLSFQLRLNFLTYAQLSDRKLWAFPGSFLPISTPLKTFFPPLHSLSHQVSPFHSCHHISGLDLCPSWIFFVLFSHLFFLPAFWSHPIQSPQNIPIRCIFPKQSSNHITHLMKIFEWLPTTF